MIKEYLCRPYRMFGTPIYDNVLRLQCNLLQIFMVFYLKYDTRHLMKIDGEKYKISEPLSRIRTRENNSKDPNFQKYLTKEFDIKGFVYQIFEDFFPNVSWRYIGAGHFAHKMAFQITEYLFTLGIW